MKRSPEKMIARLRNRKSRIIASMILSMLLLMLLSWQWYVVECIWKDSLFMEHEDLLFHVAIQQMLFIPASTLIAQSMLVAALLGLAVGSLFVNLFAYSKDDLLVNLWDRLQALEKSKQNEKDNCEAASGNLTEP
ncbi:MAG: hypothetical protein JW959_11660 [Pirellulales bacterium]|nr:hypothetical protein [Pirellulales bacterium]